MHIKTIIKTFQIVIDFIKKIWSLPFMNKIFVIAEIGINHNGSFNIAKKLIKIAKDCGLRGI